MKGRRTAGGTPPADGRWDHETVRDASLLPATPVGSTDTLAESGGLELPAHGFACEPHGRGHHHDRDLEGGENR